jgi:hypothetical protein
MDKGLCDKKKVSRAAAMLAKTFAGMVVCNKDGSLFDGPL